MLQLLINNNIKLSEDVAQRPQEHASEEPELRAGHWQEQGHLQVEVHLPRQIQIKIQIESITTHQAHVIPVPQSQIVIQLL